MAEDQKAIAARMLQQLGVGSTEKMGKAQQVKLGTHKLAVLDGGSIVNQKTKQSRNPEHRIVVDFVVLESRGPNAGDPPPYEEGAKLQIAFFVERAEFPEYEVSRFQDMVESMIVGLQSEDTQADFGGRLMCPEGRGVQCQIEVSLGNAHKKKQGVFYHDETWTAVPQSDEDVTRLDEQLTKIHGAWKAPGTIAPAPQAPAPSAPAGGRFLKR